MEIKKDFPRAKAVAALFIAALFLLLIKLFFMQVLTFSSLSKLADKQHDLFIELEPARGIIFDRNMRPLSINSPVESLFAVPYDIEDKEKTAARISSITGISQPFILERLSRKKHFIWIARKLPPEQTSQIKALKLKGLDFIKEHRRFYPGAHLASQIIGFAGIDNNGLEGLELRYDAYLKGESGWCLVLRDAHQRKISLEKKFVPPQDGYNLVLTIDETIQFIAERELERIFTKHRAQGAVIIVMDPFTGEILAWANRPTYNLNAYADYKIENRRNRAISDFFEPGSVFKIVTASAALEEKKISEEDKVFCENGEYRVANHILHDHRPHGVLTFREVIQQSSNIGTTKVAQMLGAETVYRYAKLFGFGELTGIDMPGEVSGNVKKPSVWSKTSIGAIPIGQEVVVTALQLVCAISSIANGGVLVKPFVVRSIEDNKGEVIKEFKPTAVRRVITPETSQRMKEILAGVIETGTGRMAQIEDVRAAGKTGTAQKVSGGTYSHSSFIASFIGFAPADNPRLAVVVVVDEPHGTYYGGTVAAPVFKNVVSNVLKYLDSKGIQSAEPAQLKTQ